MLKKFCQVFSFPTDKYMYKATQTREEKMLNFFKKFGKKETKKMQWPCKENQDKGFGRSGYDSLYN